MAFKRTRENYPKIMADRQRTPFQRWYKKIKEVYGKEGMDFMLSDAKTFKDMRGISAKEKTFNKNLFAYIRADLNGQTDKESAQQLSRKSVEHYLITWSWLLYATYRKGNIDSFLNIFKR